MATLNQSANIQKLQDGLLASTRKVWLAGLGAISAVEDEGVQLFDQLVERGKSIEAKGRKQVTKVKKELDSTTGDLSDKFDRQVSEVLRRMGVPSRSQVEELTVRVEKLTAKVDRLASPARKPAARKATKKTAKKSTTKRA